MASDERCAGKTVLVTGAQRGIGRAIAVRFAEAGADVALNFLDDKAATDAAAEEIRTWANERLEKIQRLADVRVVPELPRSPIGKVLKRELRAGYRD